MSIHEDIIVRPDNMTRISVLPRTVSEGYPLVSTNVRDDANDLTRICRVLLLLAQR